MTHLLCSGLAGFCGAHFAEHVLRNTDHTITIIDRLTYAGNLNRLAEMDCWEKEKSRVRFVYHDFRSPFVGRVLDKALAKQPDFICHLAAETHVDNSIKDPMLFAESNVIGTVNMLELARIAHPKLFYYQGTDESYGAVKMGELHKEGEPHLPSNPYAASKAAAEDFCKAYFKTYGLPMVIGNSMNLFGERQETEKFIPKVIKAVYTGQEVTLHCKMDGDRVVEVSSRCWLHARNLASGILFLLDHGVPGESYNIVGEWMTVQGIADMIADILKRELRVRYEDFHSTRPSHDLHYGLDGSKLDALGWHPVYDLEESMTRTVRWTVEHREWLGLE